jgi:secreted PhoX family phosphatase
MIEDYKLDMGASVLDIYLSSGGNWLVKRGSALNRRFTVNSLAIADGPALQGVSNVGGTLGNCSGCLTPWNTVLTCEENYQDYVPENS